jgi:hypothetical protein
VNGDWSQPVLTPRAGALSATTDASGFVTVAHGGSVIPKSVQVSGRNFGWEPYLVSLTATTFTVSFVSRANGSLPSSAISVSFDWACFF